VLVTGDAYDVTCDAHDVHLTCDARRRRVPFVPPQFSRVCVAVVCHPSSSSTNSTVPIPQPHFPAFFYVVISHTPPPPPQQPTPPPKSFQAAPLILTCSPPPLLTLNEQIMSFISRRNVSRGNLFDRTLILHAPRLPLSQVTPGLIAQFMVEGTLHSKKVLACVHSHCWPCVPLHFIPVLPLHFILAAALQTPRSLPTATCFPLHFRRFVHLFPHFCTAAHTRARASFSFPHAQEFPLSLAPPPAAHCPAFAAQSRRSPARKRGSL